MNAELPKERAAFIPESIKYNICHFCASTGIATTSDMVQCDACSKWYHTICIGICVHHFDDQTRFWCCQAQAQDEQFEYVFIQDTVICVISFKNLQSGIMYEGKKKKCSQTK